MSTQHLHHSPHRRDRDNDDGDDAVGHESDTDSNLARRIQQQAASAGRPSSIDMALNLERQLDAEHDPDHGNGDADAEGEASTRPVSLDPLVLSSIVANLRAELARVSRERNDLVDALAASPSREAELREALALLTERCAALEAELERLRRKSQDDDDAINMLRTKVEESRRGLMRLQTESKRMSQMSIDTGRANSLFSNPPSSSKRASFTPLTGTGAARMQAHRRISSVSEPAFMAMGDALANDTASLHLSPMARGFSLPDDIPDAKKARRSSGFFGARPSRAADSPSPPKLPNPLAPEPAIEPAAAQLEMLRRERDAARAELGTVRRELCEAQDAREASEQCVAALRAFISEHEVGERTASSGSGSNFGSGAGGILKLPPLPTDKNIDLDGEVQKSKPGAASGSVSGSGSGWSFGKLWRADSGGVLSPGSRSAPMSLGATPAHEAAPSVVTAPSAAPAAGTGAASPSTLSRKFGGFFAARAPSITSIASATSSQASARPPTAFGQQEPTLNGLGSGSDGEGDADESADADTDEGPPEPASPVHEHGLGLGLGLAPRVMVRDATNASSASSAGSDLGRAGDAAPLGAKAAPAPEAGAEAQLESSA
ncbi:hypothetical protein DFH11DRAFT_1853034 [Phellopilus nigrolimitatus]|nr:hypothetical protein DFH11DRAFT_1853034 [Phellopilus nigrolimitatus]